MKDSLAHVDKLALGPAMLSADFAIHIHIRNAHKTDRVIQTNTVKVLAFHAPLHMYKNLHQVFGSETSTIMYKYATYT